jgi:oxygen-dependent protoporphyrinogen oxidase
MTPARRVVIVGGGITGLTAAFSLASRSAEPLDITVLEARERTGGLIHTSPFAGLDAVDEGADAFLARVPWATELAHDIGLTGALTSPSASHAWIWHNTLQPIPGDIMLGVPASVGSFSKSRLFSISGKLRAGLDLVLPQTKKNDCIGDYIRHRFGTQVQERLVDPLVGSIYAADTDNFSIEAVPQIAALTESRSMLLAARKARSQVVSNEPVFATPLRGVGAMISTLEQRTIALGVRIQTNAAVSNIVRDGNSYRIATQGDIKQRNEIENGEITADAVILASPAAHTARFTSSLHPDISRALSQWDHADVILVTLAIPRSQWSDTLTGSGYLVPKPDQRWVTAVSFGSNKWAHWKNNNNDMILRVSLGRDGVEVMHLSDEEVINLVLADLTLHLGRDFVPRETRITRWVDAFPQYRPHHFATLTNVEKTLHDIAPGVFLAGASYRGIGIPACVQQAHHIADTAAEYLSNLAD